MSTPNKYLQYAIDNASKYGVPQQVASAIMNIESSGGTNIGPSSAGAVGPMQIMPKTAAALGGDPNNPYQNIDMGLKTLGQNFKQTGNWDDAAAGYNYGPGRVVATGGDYSKLPVQTQNYVRKFQSLTPNIGGNSVPQVKNADDIMAQIQSDRQNTQSNSGIVGHVKGTADDLMAQVQSQGSIPAPGDPNSDPNTVDTLVVTAPRKPVVTGPNPSAPLIPNAPQGWVGDVNSGGRGLVDGLSFGLFPHIAAGIHALGGEPYGQALAKERALNAQAQQQHPFLYGAGDVAGAILPAAIPIAGPLLEGSMIGRGIVGAAKAASFEPVGDAAANLVFKGAAANPILNRLPGWAPQLVKGATQGAVAGGIRGAASSNNLNQLPANATEGALAGGALGGVVGTAGSSLPAVAKGVQYVGKVVKPYAPYIGVLAGAHGGIGEAAEALGGTLAPHVIAPVLSKAGPLIQNYVSPTVLGQGTGSVVAPQAPTQYNPNGSTSNFPVLNPLTGLYEYQQ